MENQENSAMPDKKNMDIFPNGPLKILCLDCNDQDLETMQRFLSNNIKVQLACVKTLEEFKQRLSEARFNCLIIDYQTSKVNIFEIVYRLFEENPQRPVIIVSRALDTKLTTSFEQFPFLKFVSKDNLKKDILEKLIIELVHAAQVKKEKVSQQGGALGFEDKLSKQKFYIDVIETMDEGLVTIDTNGCMLFANKTILRLLKYKNIDILGHDVSMLVPESQSEYFRSQVKNVFSGKPKITFELELQGRNEIIIPVLIHTVQMLNDNNEIIGAFFTFTDLSEIKYKEAQLMGTNIMLERQSRIDALTGLLNYRSLRECIDLEFIKARAEKKTLILVMLGLDYFKLLNNNLGHNFGDFVLKEMAEIIQKEIQDKDIAGRKEADEFTIALVDSSYEQGIMLSEHFRKIIAERLFQDGELSSRVTVTIGVASLKDDGAKSVPELLDFGDRAVRQGKIKGRNTVVAYQNLEQKENQAILEKEKDKISVIEKQLVNLADSSKKSYMESAKALIAALEAKDPYTKEHSVNVATFASLIAKELGLSDEQVELISDAAQLHDIGKIGIPESILLKSGKLTHDEYEIVKKHPLISIQILKRIKYLESELPIIQCHHERPDGKGYPAGLALIDIPLGAQIISVADSYDAMISLRSYRDALKKIDAMEELKNNAGSQFNPEIVIAFLKVLLKNSKEEGEKNYIIQSIKEISDKFQLSN